MFIHVCLYQPYITDCFLLLFFIILYFIFRVFFMIILRTFLRFVLFNYKLVMTAIETSSFKYKTYNKYS